MAISRANKCRQFSLIIHDIFSLFNFVVKLTIGHFATSAKSAKIPQNYQNSVEKGKFHG